MKRVVLFLATNIAVLLVLSLVISLLGLDRWMAAEGIDYRALLAFSAVLGFGGSLISLAMSKAMAKWSTGAHVIDGTEGTTEYWLVQTVKRLADKAGIGMPEVAVYEGAPNAFATGAFRNSSLVAVSTGLLQSMSKEEVEAVLGHEIGHVANGDMVTLTLIQGVVNTFVVFLSRVVGYFVDKAVFRTERGIGPGFYITVIVCQIVFGILASLIVAWFSRQREFRADAASADLLGNPRPMMNALARLGGLEPGALPEAIRTAGITDKPSGFAALFSTHPPVEERIAALQARAAGQV
ncbi:MAG: protease HtpX [Betaproteobacteria bacterium]|nr:protease HtpX [Betaproteobacteria bacterium]MDH5220269.1 protease HtpX [Betaproteobacteria bacterium]